MKKKSILGRVAIIAMALTLATTSMMSGTLARYEKDATVTPYALIAQWEPAITAGNNQTVTGLVDLTDTTAPGVTFKNNSQVIGTDTSAMIAPGTSGQYEFKIDCSKADVNTVATITAKPKTGYTIPSHLVVTIEAAGMGAGGAAKQVGKMEGTYSASSWVGPFGAAENKSFDIIGGEASATGNKPLLFKTVKAKGTKQVLSLTLKWDWPMDRTDDAAQTSKETTDAAYNTTDTEYGQQISSANQKFGFDLVINLQQSGAIASEDNYQVVETKS